MAECRFRCVSGCGLMRCRQLWSGRVRSIPVEWEFLMTLKRCLAEASTDLPRTVLASEASAGTDTRTRRPNRCTILTRSASTHEGGPMNFCTECGTEFEAEDRFCTGCGNARQASSDETRSVMSTNSVETDPDLSQMGSVAKDLTARDQSPDPMILTMQLVTAIADADEARTLRALARLEALPAEDVFDSIGKLGRLIDPKISRARRHAMLDELSDIDGPDYVQDAVFDIGNALLIAVDSAVATQAIAYYKSRIDSTENPLWKGTILELVAATGRITRNLGIRINV